MAISKNVIVFLVFIIFFISIPNTVLCRKDRTSTQSQHHQNRNNREDKIEPRVIALSPKGLRVTIPDRPGMELFAFHGKVNSPIRQSDSGSLSKDVNYPVNGEWTFENLDVHLQIGDVINYWIFVQINGMGRRIDNLSSVVRDLIPAHKTQSPTTEAAIIVQQALSSFRDESNSYQRQTTTPRTTATTTTTRSSHSSKHQCACDLNELGKISDQLKVALSQLNSVNNIVQPLQNQVESLKEILNDLLKDKNIGTKLLLTGQQPPGNPAEAIRMLVSDKLQLTDLEDKILQAFWTENGISFEVSSPMDKKRILYRAQKRLKNSKYQILDPEGNSNAAYTITDDMMRNLDPSRQSNSPSGNQNQEQNQYQTTGSRRSQNNRGSVSSNSNIGNTQRTESQNRGQNNSNDHSRSDQVRRSSSDGSSSNQQRTNEYQNSRRRSSTEGSAKNQQGSNEYQNSQRRTTSEGSSDNQQRSNENINSQRRTSNEGPSNSQHNSNQYLNAQKGSNEYPNNQQRPNEHLSAQRRDSQDQNAYVRYQNEFDNSFTDQLISNQGYSRINTNHQGIPQPERDNRRTDFI